MLAQLIDKNEILSLLPYMVWFPCLLTWLRPLQIPYKLQLSLESCDSPTPSPTHLVIWMRGMDVDMSKWNRNIWARLFLSYEVNLGGLRSCHDLWPSCNGCCENISGPCDPCQALLLWVGSGRRTTRWVLAGSGHCSRRMHPRSIIHQESCMLYIQAILV